MKRNRFNLSFAYLLMGTLLLSTGVLYYGMPRNLLSYFQTSVEASLLESSQDSTASGGSSGDLCRVPSPEPSVNGPVHVTPRSVEMINRFYEAHERSGERAQNVVPRLFSVSIPGDIRLMKKPQARRDVFIKMVLPLVLRANEQVLAQRARLLAIAYRQHHGLPLTPEDRSFIRQIAHEYKMPAASVPGLLKRVDLVPPSLALAQAILESGNGTSCAAINKCSIFGHMATMTQVKSFSSLAEGVNVYVRNLNRNPAYGSFRLLRHQLRTENKPLSGCTLAGGLLKYSVRGSAYIRDVQKIIRLYKLERFDTSVLQQAPSNSA